MNSALYACKILHHRFSPKVHKFAYSTFMWYLDLDELNSLHTGIFAFSYKRFNLFSFWDKDHLNPNEKKAPICKEELLSYLLAEGVLWDGHRAMLLTNMRTLGYLFNPVSFYYCYQKSGELCCAVAQVGNTYYEMKTYVLPNFDGDAFKLRTPKYFYVSPFTLLNDEFDFKLKVPNEKLQININDYRDGECFFTSTLLGERVNLSNANVIGYFIKFPFITLQIIALIHWQALKLWFKKVPFQAKTANKNLQKNVQRKHSSLRD